MTSAGAAGAPAPGTTTTQTIVMVRHGEKPAQGLGQLSCQGLNRALALPSVIEHQFGRPARIFAPDPAAKKVDDGKTYDYVRPLATIEPTAIAFGLPVDAGIGWRDIEGLRQRLETPSRVGAFVLVAWEHHMIVVLARRIMAEHGADPASVPDWAEGDFDSIYIVKVTRMGDRTTAAFERGREGLDNQPTTCPGRAAG